MTKFKQLSFIVFYASLLLFTCGCEREWVNPFDDISAINPETWAPQNFQVEDVSITEKKLSWYYTDKNIEGFKVDLKKGEEPWQEAYQTFSKEIRSWKHTDIVPEPDLTVQYRLYAFAGKNNSTSITISTNVTIPPPTGLSIDRVSILIINLKWLYTHSGHDGFAIERKHANKSWEQIATTLSTEFIDSSFVLNSTINYRVKAFYNQYYSDFSEAYFSSIIPAPDDLKITFNSLNSFNLTWSYDFNDHHGFVIDKKVSDGSWINGFAFIDANQNLFTDNEVELGYHHTYRVYAYYEEFISSKCEGMFFVPNIGQFHQGGIVFYLNENGGGLVCAESDQSTNAAWGCFGITIGASGFEIGNGSTYTAAIVAACSDVGIAARVCNDLVLNGYNDWFLPSLNELREMFINLGINGTGYLEFANGWYWSSSESNSNLAWQYYYTGYIYKKTEKNQTGYVRAIRPF